MAADERSEILARDANNTANPVGPEKLVVDPATDGFLGKGQLVGDISAGVAVNYGNTKLAYALVYRTKEFSEQVDDGQIFGTVSINVSF